MAKNDYFVIACRILVYLYACLKSDEDVDTEEISPEKLNINPKYWLYVIEHLQKDGYVEGVYIGKLLGAMPSVKLEEITPKGIEYLQENSTMKKAIDFLKTLKDIAPGM